MDRKEQLARIEALEAEAWQADAQLGVRDYLVIRGVQRYGAWLFGLDFLVPHAFGFAAPQTMNLPAVVAAFVGLHLAGGAIGLLLWSRNRLKYGLPEA